MREEEEEEEAEAGRLRGGTGLPLAFIPVDRVGGRVRVFCTPFVARGLGRFWVFIMSSKDIISLSDILKECMLNRGSRISLLH